MKSTIRITAFLLATGLLWPFPGLQTATSTAHDTSTETKRAPAKLGRSEGEIAEAKAKGLVWVNSATRVYHKEGPLYGKTRLGKFMTEEDAKKAGYRMASENGNGHKNGSGESKQPSNRAEHRSGEGTSAPPPHD